MVGQQPVGCVWTCLVGKVTVPGLNTPFKWMKLRGSELEELTSAWAKLDGFVSSLGSTEARAPGKVAQVLLFFFPTTNLKPVKRCMW